jgi:hypothetical protein
MYFLMILLISFLSGFAIGFYYITKILDVVKKAGFMS